MKVVIWLEGVWRLIAGYYFSRSRGINIVKLQGLVLKSSWALIILSQPVLHAPDDPGRQKT